MSDDFNLQEKRGLWITVEWKIEEFFSLSNHVGYHVKSPNFSLSDANWYLVLYPNGNFAGCVGRAALYLVRDSSTFDNHQVNCTMGIKKYDGSSYKSFDGEYTFKVWNDAAIGSHELFKLSELRDSMDVLDPYGTLIVFCTVHLVSASVAEIACQTKSMKSTDTLIQDLEDLLLTGRHGDVTIKIKDQEFRAHRSILSTRSPVFDKMFDHDMLEKTCGVINIDDCDPASFQKFLLFLYTGNIDYVTPENAPVLYEIAHKYDMNELKKECAQCMGISLSVDSFCEVVSIAAVYNESEMLEIATEFFIKHFNSIFVTSKWQTLLLGHPTLVNELLVKMGKRVVIQK